MIDFIKNISKNVWYGVKFYAKKAYEFVVNFRKEIFTVTAGIALVCAANAVLNAVAQAMLPPLLALSILCLYVHAVLQFAIYAALLLQRIATKAWPYCRSAIARVKKFVVETYAASVLFNGVQKSRDALKNGVTKAKNFGCFISAKAERVKAATAQIATEQVAAVKVAAAAYSNAVFPGRPELVVEMAEATQHSLTDAEFEAAKTRNQVAQRRAAKAAKRAAKRAQLIRDTNK